MEQVTQDKLEKSNTKTNLDEIIKIFKMSEEKLQ